MSDSAFKRIKVITSHSGLARWLAETKSAMRWLARVQREGIPSPYTYSPSTEILNWRGRACIYSETSHRRYEVYAIGPGMLTFGTMEAAIQWHIRFCREREMHG